MSILLIVLAPLVAARVASSWTLAAWDDRRVSKHHHRAMRSLRSVSGDLTPESGAEPAGEKAFPPTGKAMAIPVHSFERGSAADVDDAEAEFGVFGAAATPSEAPRGGPAEGEQPKAERTPGFDRPLGPPPLLPTGAAGVAADVVTPDPNSTVGPPPPVGSPRSPSGRFRRLLALVAAVPIIGGVLLAVAISGRHTQKLRSGPFTGSSPATSPSATIPTPTTSSATTTSSSVSTSVTTTSPTLSRSATHARPSARPAATSTTSRSSTQPAPTAPPTTPPSSPSTSSGPGTSTTSTTNASTTTTRGTTTTSP